MSSQTSRPVRIPTIDCSRDDAAELFAKLRAKLSPKGDVVSETGRRRTLEIFGEALSPQQVVERICRDVREQGLAAVFDYSRKLDKKDLTAETLRVQPAELEAAHRRADPQYLAALRRIRANIVEFQRSLLCATAVIARQDGPSRIELRQRYLPLRRVGICIPGGAAAYPSTLLMTAVPAQVAGEVKEIAVAVPPTEVRGLQLRPFGRLSRAGDRRDLPDGWGTGRGRAGVRRRRDRTRRQNCRTGQPVRKLLAKKHVFGEVDIDSIAGPSEVVVLARPGARGLRLCRERPDLASRAQPRIGRVDHLAPASG